MVGTKYATCFWSTTALKAARMATSVLPKPTSPQSKRSIGFGCSISFLVSSIQRSWSSVSIYSKLSSNCFCHGVSAEKANPFTFWRFAYSSMRSLATSCKFFFTLVLVFSHSLLPRRFTLGAPSPPPMYLRILSKDSVGMYSISSFL